MINWLHSRMFRPVNGWDPVSAIHAKQYAVQEWSSGVNDELIDTLASWCHGLAGKTVLDLGGGPGQYAVAFAKRGAKVTWYDISHLYRKLAEEKAREHEVSIRFATGYLDEAMDTLDQRFDLVFNRLCWNYSRGDDAFSKVLYKLVEAGGVGYIDTTHSEYMRDTLSFSSRIRTALNKYTGWKVGHPYPPHRRLEEIFARYPMETIFADYSSPMNDRILFRKPQNKHNG